MRGENVEPCKDVVVHQSNDMLCHVERVPEMCIDCRGIFTTRFVEGDEYGGIGDPSGCGGETRGGQDCG